jgi:hypothetical protein
MVTIQIRLSEALYDELRLAAADCGELDEPEVCSVEDFARELVEVELAERRENRKLKEELWELTVAKLRRIQACRQ